MKTYRVGVLGCGEVWKSHKLAFEQSQRIKCTVMFDPATDKAKAAAAENGARVADSASDLINSPDVDIVAILTPVFTHADLVEQAAAAGKHLMLEKPMAVTMHDAQRITTAIDKAGVKCHHPTLRALFSDLYDELYKWTRPSGQLGQVKAAFYHLVAWSIVPGGWMADRDRCFPPAEYAPHVLDTFLSLTGDEPATVYCHAGNYARPFKQNDVNTIDITFKQNRFLQIGVHWVVDPAWNAPARITYEIICEKGIIHHNWTSAKYFTRDGQGEFTSNRIETRGGRHDHYHQLIDAIENNTPLHPDHHDGQSYVRILDAAYRSSQSGKTITL